MPQLKLMPEYRADGPLWGMDLGLLDLPGSLMNRIGDWQQFFDDNCDFNRKWTSDDAKVWWATESDEIVVELRMRLPRDVELIVDLWPLEN